MENKREIYTDHKPCIRESEDGALHPIDGYAVVFEKPSGRIKDWRGRYIEVIKRGAITQELLDRSDIRMTLWHNRERLLARRNKGEGSLKMGVDDFGVWYSFLPPETADGVTARELVKRGDLSGASFTAGNIEIESKRLPNGEELQEVVSIGWINEITITNSPAYADTTVNAREVEQSIEPKREDPNIGKRAAREIEKIISSI